MDKAPAVTALHWPCLWVGVGLMLLGSVWPFVLADAQGRAHHGALLLLMWAMAAGLIRGVGFIPHHPLLRWMASGWGCLVGLAGFVGWRLFLA